MNRFFGLTKKKGKNVSLGVIEPVGVIAYTAFYRFRASSWNRATLNRERERKKEKERKRERERERERVRERGRQTDRDRDRKRETWRQRDINLSLPCRNALVRCTGM